MILLEQLYRLKFGDDQVRHLDPWQRIQSTGGAGVLVEVAEVIPERTALLLHHVLSTQNPGAGQNLIELGHILFVSNPQGNPLVVLAQSSTPLAADASSVLSWQGEIVLTPGCFIRARGEWNAGANVNTISLSTIGMLVPLGNIERL